jgi:GNAT superfamily N-acetyltransferase
VSPEGIEYRDMRPGEERWVSELIVRAFQEFISAHYPRAGVRDFLAYVSPAALRQRADGDHRILVALDGHRIVGAVDVDDYRHLDLLFVEKAYHGRGIAREFVQRVIEAALEAQPDLKEITADTSEYGQPLYEAMGFETAGPEMIEHGRHFRRMRLKLKKFSRR